MSFLKLDCKILDSTIWMDREAREVFLTALLMAKPRRIEVAMEQLEVRRIERTGFVVPPGWYGFVSGAGPGIVNRAGVEMEAGLMALERLGSPEPMTSSAAFDGRRLVRVDGGYVVLNFMLYRDKDHTAPQRAQRYRDERKKRGRKSGAQTRAENDSREARYMKAETPEEEDRIAAEGLPGAYL